MGKGKRLKIKYQSWNSLQDADDAFVGKITSGLLLFLGVLLIAGSAVLVAYSAVLVIYRQQFVIEFLTTLVFTIPLLGAGLGLLYYMFLKRRMIAFEKSLPLGLALPQRILCEKCGVTLYDGPEPTSPYKIVESHNGRCPNCGEELLSKCIRR